MPKTFSFKKTALLVAASATALGVHISSTAQDATLTINGQINAASCVLLVGSQQGGNTVLNLGTFTTTAASNTALGNTFNTTGATVVFRAVNADLTSSCTSLAGNRWDLGLDLTSVNVVTAGGRSFITSQSVSGSTSAQNVGVAINTSFGPSVTAGATPLNLNAVNGGGVGVFMSGTASGVLASDRIALTALFGRSGASAPTVGSFSATIPINLWYR